MQLPLNKICEPEDSFVKVFSKNGKKILFKHTKRSTYNLEIDYVIRLPTKFVSNYLMKLNGIVKY